MPAGQLHAFFIRLQCFGTAHALCLPHAVALYLCVGLCALPLSPGTYACMGFKTNSPSNIFNSLHI